MRARERQASAAADAAAVRVRGLEAALADLRASADAPEAELRCRAAEVRQAHAPLWPLCSEHGGCVISACQGMQIACAYESLELAP